MGLGALIGTVTDGRAARTSGPELDSKAEGSVLADIAAEMIGEADAAMPVSDIEQVIQAKRGDTFMKLMRNAGVPPEDAHAAIVAMHKVYNPRDLRPGQRITVSFRPDTDDSEKNLFLGFRFHPTVEQAIHVDRAEDGFNAEAVDRELNTRTVRLARSIDANLYTAASAVGLPPSTIVELIRLFSWDVDFQRDIQPGDRFDVMIQRRQQPDGRIVAYGDILYAELTLSGTSHRLYRFETPKHGADYYDDEGRSVRKALLRTPIDGARLSSGYGKRRHPILGYTKMHRGLDFAAPTGTPIYAAGNGTIEMAGRNGAYGNYVRIRHNSSHATAYAHMSRFGRGIRVGARVKQGQVIGYVGTTGRSTGPHLHYEMLANGRQTNPLKVKFPVGPRLTGTELARFHAVVGEVRTRLAGTDPETRVGEALTR